MLSKYISSLQASTLKLVEKSARYSLALHASSPCIFIIFILIIKLVNIMNAF